MTDDTRDPFDDRPRSDWDDVGPVGGAADTGREGWDYGPGSGGVHDDLDPGTWHDGATHSAEAASEPAPADISTSDDPEHATEPAEPAAPPAPAAPQRSVVIFGPMQSGKTVLLLSLVPCMQAWGRRLHQEESAGRRWWIEMTAGEGTRFLTREAVRTIVEPDHSPLASSRLQEFEFSASVTEEQGLARPARRTDAQLTFYDGPGGHVVHPAADWDRPESDAAEYERPTIEAAREAHTLVLTVDLSNPEPDVLSGNLADLLGRCSVDVTCAPPPSPWLFRLRRRLGLTREQPPAAQRLRRLACRNFLLLLTKADRIVSPEILGAAQGGSFRAGAFSRSTPLEVARRLDPLGQALQAVGRSNLLTILNALQPGSRFAIGACSSWGFLPNGHAFMNRAGTDPVMSGHEGRADRVRLWNPYGVQDALRFMVSGSAGGAVRLVTRADLQQWEDDSLARAARLHRGRQVGATHASEGFRRTS